MRTVYFAGVLSLVILFSSCAGRNSSAADAPKSAAAEKNNSAKNHAENKGDTEQSQSKDSIELSIDTQHRLGITVSPVSKRLVPIPLVLNGTVQPIENRMAHIRPLTSGRITKLFVRIGERVRAGQPLAEFDNIEAGELASQYESARAKLAGLKIQAAVQARQVERDRNLVKIGAVPQKEFEASQAEQEGMQESIRAQQAVISGLEYRLHRFGVDDVRNALKSSTTLIKSPLAGVVIRVGAGLGDVVDPSTELFAVADLSKVYVQAQVYEKDLGRVRVGQPATVKVEAYGGEAFQGRVVSIGDVIDTQTRTAPVRCEVANHADRLKVDMFATIDLPTGSTRPEVVVPVDAVQNYQGETVVFIAQSSTRFAAHPIEAGQTVGSAEEVTGGLKEGERVVTRGAFQVKSALLAKGLGEEE